MQNVKKRKAEKICFYLLIRSSWNNRYIKLECRSPKYMMNAAEASQRKFSRTSIHVLPSPGLGSEEGRGLEHASSSSSSPLLAYPWLCLCLINPPPPVGVPLDMLIAITKSTCSRRITETSLIPHPDDSFDSTNLTKNYISENNNLPQNEQNLSISNNPLTNWIPPRNRKWSVLENIILRTNPKSIRPNEIQNLRIS